MFELPKYREPDFTDKKFTDSPDPAWENVTIKCVDRDNYDSTSMYT